MGGVKFSTGERCQVFTRRRHYLEPHQAGDSCEWTECPIGAFDRASRGDAASVTPRRSERHEMTLETGQHLAGDESAAPPARTAVARTSRGDADNRLLRRMNEGCGSASDLEAVERDEREMLHTARRPRVIAIGPLFEQLVVVPEAVPDAA